jgi:TRAP-type C4-dicarboxylate transport system permease small subunit
MSKLNDMVLKVQEYIMAVFSIVIAFMILMSAVMRYVFHTDFYGMEEIVIILAFWLYFLGSAYAAHEDSHINADLLSSFATTKKSKNILAIIKYSLSLLVSLLTTYWCVGFIVWNIGMNPKSPVYSIPLVISQVSILVSFALMSIYILGHLLNSVKELRNN